MALWIITIVLVAINFNDEILSRWHVRRMLYGKREAVKRQTVTHSRYTKSDRATVVLQKDSTEAVRWEIATVLLNIVVVMLANSAFIVGMTGNLSYGSKLLVQLALPFFMALWYFAVRMSHLFGYFTEFWSSILFSLLL